MAKHNARKKEAERKTRSAVPAEFKKLYGAAQSCGDEISELLHDADLDGIAERNDIDISRWAGLNPGMVRMNLGNVLRGKIRRGDRVAIGKTVFNRHAKAA